MAVAVAVVAVSVPPHFEIPWKKKKFENVNFETSRDWLLVFSYNMSVYCMVHQYMRIERQERRRRRLPIHSDCN
jgi:hypothetical protein